LAVCLIVRKAIDFASSANIYEIANAVANFPAPNHPAA